MKFGDVLCYPKADDPDENWLFMHIAPQPDYQYIIVMKIHPDDDQWMPGKILVGGPEEFTLTSRATMLDMPQENE